MITHGIWPQVGGLERQTYDCAVGFSQAGHDVQVVSTVGKDSALPERQTIEVGGGPPVRLHRYRLRWYEHGTRDPLADPTIPVAAYKELTGAWARDLVDADVVCTFGATPAIVGGAIKESDGTPLVAVLPGIPPETDERFEEVRVCGADAFVSVSEFMRERARALYGMRMVNIYNGIDTEYFRPMRRQLPYGFLNDLPGPLICSPVRLDPSKGIPVLLDAFEVVHRELPRATLLITGNGSLCSELGMTASYHGYLVDLVKEKGLGERVVFAKGAIAPEDMPAVYTMSTVSVMTSLSEGWGLGNAEALACGTPAVATRTEGMQEVFVDGHGGYYADVGAVDQVAEKVLLLLRDEGLRARMGAEGREYIRRTFPLARQTESYLRLFEQLSVPA